MPRRVSHVIRPLGWNFWDTALGGLGQGERELIDRADPLRADLEATAIHAVESGSSDRPSLLYCALGSRGITPDASRRFRSRSAHARRAVFSFPTSEATGIPRAARS